MGGFFCTFFRNIKERRKLNMSEILTSPDPLKKDYAAMTLAEIAARPESIASRLRVAANQAMSPEAREAKLAELIARVKSRRSRVPTGK